MHRVRVYDHDIVMDLHIPVDELPPFSYEPLDVGRGEIRLLSAFQPSSDYSLIKCTLHNVPIQEANGFLAITVSQDEEQLEETKDHVIWCNEQPLAITQKVYNAVRSNVKKDVPIWIAEICIDHDNSEERGRQSDLRAEILQRAALREVGVSPFKYPPLLHASDEIRLVRVSQNMNGVDMLHLYMTTVSLRDDPQYEILTVQDPMAHVSAYSSSIITWCNGQGLVLPASVHSTLRRSIDAEHGYLWIEGVCANKDDVAEMEYHTKLKDHIHKQAIRGLHASRSHYQYTPLDSVKNEIRLLRIFPSPDDLVDHDSPLVIELFTASLNENPEYTALSYYWGSDEQKCGVVCADGTIHKVTTNLFLSLYDLRLHGYKVLWIDQICIDQADLAERGRQVTMMSRIYGQAKSVVVELGGKCTPTLDLDYSKQWYDLMKKLAAVRLKLQEERPDRPHLRESEYADYGIPPTTDPSWNEWLRLRAEPWFRRAWVIQEAVACSQVRAIYDRRHFDWHDIVNANNAVVNESTKGNNAEALDGRKTLHLLSEFIRSTGRPKIDSIEILTALRLLHATNPRDKIYAFHGLCSDRSTLPVPNYVASAEQIYIEYARHIVLKGQGMNLISEAGRCRQNMTDIPSWVADWSFAETQQYNYARGGTWTCFCPSRKVKDSVLPVPKENGVEAVTLTSDISVIAVRGSILTTITFVTPEHQDLTRYDLESTWLQVFAEFDETARDIVRQLAVANENNSIPSVYGSDLWEAYAQTLIGGVYTSDHVSAAYEEFRSFVQDERKDQNTDQPDQYDDRLDRLGKLRKLMDNRSYKSMVAEHWEKHRFCITENGYMGLVPRITNSGDRICVLPGVRAPIVLRSISGPPQNKYELIGDCYLHQFMQTIGVSVLPEHCETFLLS